MWLGSVKFRLFGNIWSSLLNIFEGLFSIEKNVENILAIFNSFGRQVFIVVIFQILNKRFVIYVYTDSNIKFEDIVRLLNRCIS